MAVIIRRMLLLPLLLAMVPEQVMSDPISELLLMDIQKIAALANDVVTRVKQSYNSPTKPSFTSTAPDDIFKYLATISNQIHEFVKPLSETIEPDTYIQRNVMMGEDLSKFDNNIRMIRTYLTNIKTKWSNYIQYARRPAQFRNRTLRAFSRLSGEIEEELQKMHSTIIPREGSVKETWFLLMVKCNNVADFLTCDWGISHQQEIYELYYDVSLGEIQGFLMIAYAYALAPMFDEALKDVFRDFEISHYHGSIIADDNPRACFIYNTSKLLQLGTYTTELTTLEAQFTRRMLNYMLAANEAMQVASNAIQRCDPRKGYKKGKTYAEMEGAFQTFVINEVNTNGGQSCDIDCADVQNRLQVNNKTASNGLVQEWCAGSIHHCRPAGTSVQFCPSKPGSSRYYEWIVDGFGATLGQKKSCSNSVKVEEWFSFFRYCEYCICSCSGGKKGNFKPIISLRPALTDIDNNMVVTGIKIHYKDNIVQLQVQQGELRPEGEILKGSEKWVPREAFQYGESQDRPHLKNGKLIMEDVDYVVINEEHREISLDDLQLPDGHLLAGVQFQITSDKSRIRLQALAVPFNYSNGKLQSTNHEWIHPLDSGERAEVILYQPDVPLKHNRHIPKIQTNRYVSFRETDQFKDAGQTVIPFWDIQEVITAPSNPLQGVGLFHKGDENGFHGGYLGLRLLSFNVSHYMKTELSINTTKSYESIDGEPTYIPKDLIHHKNFTKCQTS